MMLIKEAKHFYPRCRDRLYVDADVKRKQAGQKKIHAMSR